MAIEIKSSLLNDDDFKYTKESLIAVSEIDHKEQWRVKMIEYINQKANSSQDEFFYDMLSSLLFLIPDDETTAYTSPETLIFANAPGIIGENIRQWDFVYCHECLHQLWNTFKVAEKIKNEGKEYNHYVLNIASDCVINDYLYRIRKKDRPDGLVTPELLEKKFGVKYDPQKDNQYSLYIKLLEKKNELEKDPTCQKNCKDDTKFDKKIKPISVDTVDGGGGPPPPPSGPHSDEYKKGWRTGIQDVLDKKVDPLNYTPKKEDNDYNKGYNDVIKQIEQGLKKGVQLSKSNGSSGSNASNDLADIPWDVPNQSGGGSSDDKDQAQDDANQAQDAADQAQDVADQAKKSGDKDADKKQEAADKAKEAANKAKEAAKNGDSKGAKDAANEAKDAAKEAGVSDKQLNDYHNSPASKAQQSSDNAKEWADKAKASANKAKKSGDKDANKKQEAADKAKEAADKAKEAAKKAKIAQAKGDKDAANKAAKEAQEAEDLAQNEAAQAGVEQKSNKSKSNNQNDQPGPPSKGKGTCPINIKKEDLEKIIQRNQDTIKKFQKRISGDFGEFIRKCKTSLELNPNGLSINATKASKGWNEKLEDEVITYVKGQVSQFKRQYQRSYRRLKRGTGYLQQGSILLPGKKIIDKRMDINVVFFIDRSGSMDQGNPSRLENAWKATYTICKSLKDIFGRDQCIEDINYKMVAFDTNFKEIKYGNTCDSGGCTMPFDQILDYMHENTKDYLITIIITDGEFDVHETKVINLLKESEGMIYYITCETNQGNTQISNLAKSHKDKLFYYLATNTFELT